jgi:hypothetical protein
MEYPEIEPLARICHEANRAWCEFNGDASQQPWDEAPEWARESARQGVLFHLRNPSAGDSASHDAWMKQKLADGWGWGPEKDPAAKKHPCMVPFDQLPPEQQFKDRLFRTLVHAAVPGDAEKVRIRARPLSRPLSEPLGPCPDCGAEVLTRHKDDCPEMARLSGVCSGVITEIRDAD